MDRVCLGYPYTLIFKAQVCPIMLTVVSSVPHPHLQIRSFTWGGGEEGRGTWQSTSHSLFWPSKGAAMQLAEGSLSPTLQGGRLSTAGSQAGELGSPFVVPIAWRKVS